ncbi:hypothetical protein JET14_06535 [Martelella lutilitoris]|uniref:Uncharacterized protein n=1 Tax=Martelella lutilitoris TaxID=2583532 RepID=A0A7T7KMH6_9HYPH|nr:hypothetical protein [Martelella lutilitoris]QQM31817.1 hypothetical protein JET14_06535 [Martelella lutilitoris]
MSVAALIVVTILGCDDSLTRCQYIDTAPDTYESVALCDEALERDLSHYKYSEYASVIGVCRSEDEPIETALGGMAVTGIPEEQTRLAAGPQPGNDGHVPEHGNRLLILADGALDKAVSVLPDKAQVRAVLVAPVDAVKDGYAWAVGRLGL